jgi:type IV pilus assembly protein PilW
MITVFAQRKRRPMRRDAGFTLIELMIASAVALFLVGGLLVILQNVGRAQRTQTALAQLQDNQRMAMTLIADIVQAAGYFPNPTANTLTDALPEAGSMLAGQSLIGTSGDDGDTLTVRFATTSGDTIINCIGGTNPDIPLHSYVNTFSVDAEGRLLCSLNGAAAAPLVNGVKKMEVWYGVKTNLAVDDNNVDTYLRAAELEAADWANVISVRVQLTFDASGVAGPGQTVQFTRIIGVMNKTGVKL